MHRIPTAQAELPPEMIDFGVGQPDFDILPLEIVRRAAAERLTAGDTTLLNYGYEQGDGYFRLALADFLTRGYAMPVDADSLLVTAGASQALDMLCTLYTRPGDVVLVEEPTYFIALRVFADHRLRVVGVPTDASGLRMDTLEDAVMEHRPALVYVIPSFQNPTGATLPADRRRQLAELSRRHGFTVVADEVYQLLGYTETPPAPMAAYLDQGNIVSVGSFSKILAPGLRLGWLQATPAVIDRLVNGGLIFSGGSLNHFTSNIVRVALEQGWQDDYLAELHALYRTRIDVLDAALRAELGERVSYTKPTGGYFFWLRLPESVDAAALRARAQARNVDFRPGINFSGNAGLHNYLRLSFAFYNAARLEEGARRLGQVLK
ncbi:MAG: PLP-dependent aminotransferase family protein [Caldilineaceae bacterium]|nr:PLP-dependent aminotransferase family protein [Caldilineaceae bacterium]